MFFCGFVSPLQIKPASLGFDLVPWVILEVVGQGLAFLRESHGGCNSPPDCCQEPPFESILALNPFELNFLGLDSCFFFFRSGGPKWTRTIDLTIISRVL